MNRHYLDHAATSPLRPQAAAAMQRGWELVGNPASQHTGGRRAHAALEDAREQIAAAVGAHPTEVIFTSGGTEADNLVVLGGAAWGAANGRPKVAVSTVEHPAVFEAAAGLGTQRLLLEVDAEGVITAEALTRLDATVGWASLMAVNNETGTTQPLDAFVDACRAAGVRAHSDAVQAVGHHELSFARSGLDAMSITGHKVGGPVGIGALLARRDAPLAPVSRGGGQERKLRSGTAPVALALGFAAAVATAVACRREETARLASLRRRLLAGVARIEETWINGGPTVGPAIANVTFSGVRSDDLLLLLDAAGIDASTGSACTAGVHQPSEVLLAMGRSQTDASASLRFSLGWTTQESDVDALVAVLPDAVARARAAARP